MALFQHIKAVLIDADDTLFSVTPSVTSVYREVLLRHGIEASERSIGRALVEAWIFIKPHYENASNGYRTFPGRERSLWREFSRCVVAGLETTPHSEEVFDALYERFGSGHSRALSPGVTEALLALRQRGIRTGVFTNNDSRIQRVVDELGIGHLFDALFASDTLCVKKPAREAFQLVERFFALNPEDCLLIGNSIEHDVLGARGALWSAVLFTGHDSAPSSVPLFDPPVPVVASFHEVLPFFGSV